MSLEPIFYVYVHVRKDTGRIFYVGKGSGNRAWVIKRRNVHWANVSKKAGYDIVIIRSGLIEQDAIDLEIAMIAGIGLGNLCNKTDGGDGLSGFKMNGEQKAVLVKNLTGRVFTSETREKISKALTGKTRDRAVVEAHAAKILGSKHKPESIEKIRKALTGRPVSNATREKMSRTHTGKVISEQAKINMSIAQTGKKRSKESIEKQRQTMLDRISNKKQDMYGGQMKPVECSNGMRFVSATEAGIWANQEFGKTKAKYAICNSIRLGRTAYGLTWSYIQDSKI